MLKEKILSKIEPYTKQFIDKAAPVLKREVKNKMNQTAGMTLKRIIQVGGVLLTAYVIFDPKTHTHKQILTKMPLDIPYPIQLNYTDSHNTYNYYKGAD